MHHIDHLSKVISVRRRLECMIHLYICPQALELGNKDRGLEIHKPTLPTENAQASVVVMNKAGR